MNPTSGDGLGHARAECPERDVVHPAAEVFPRLQGDAFAALVKDIQEHGQREPIVRLDGMVLDGCNRLRACRQLGIEPVIVDLIEEQVGDPIDYVVSRNFHRRHLLPREKGEILLRLLEARGGAVGANKGGRPTTKPSEARTVSVSSLAKDIGMPKQTAHDCVQAAIDFNATAPEMRDMVDAGKITPKQARNATEKAKATAAVSDGEPDTQVRFDVYARQQNEADGMRRWCASVPAGFEKWLPILPHHGDAEIREAVRQMVLRVRANLLEIEKVLAEPAAAAEPVPDCAIVSTLLARRWSLDNAVRARKAVIALPEDERDSAVEYLSGSGTYGLQTLRRTRSTRLKYYKDFGSPRGAAATTPDGAHGIDGKPNDRTDLAGTPVVATARLHQEGGP